MKIARKFDLHRDFTLKPLYEWYYKNTGQTKDSPDVNFRSDYQIGEGFVEYDFDGQYHINVGIYSYEKQKKIKDNDFVKIGVTLFHEFAHYEQSTNKDTPVEIILSDLSKYNNNNYYEKCWHMFPHEIDAEYTGVMSMWAYLGRECPDDADRLMFDYLTYKASNTIYIFNIPEDGFHSKEQVELLFENAYNKSVKEKRYLPADFLKSDDEIARLFTTESGILNTDYAPFYKQLMMSATGEEFDRKMASLVSYIHPELQELYQYPFERMTPTIEFASKLPETTDEIRNRIYPDNSFENAVRSIPTETNTPIL